METKHNTNQSAGGEDIAAILIRLPRVQKDRLRKIATNRHRTLNGELRTLIDQHIAEATEGEQDPTPLAS